MAMKKFIVALLLLSSSTVYGVDTFQVKSIHFEGLQRISISTAMLSVPFHVGNIVSKKNIANMIQSLFATGNFESVNVLTDNEKLVIRVQERPIITEIIFSGNKMLSKKQLNTNLNTLGIRVGEPINYASLNLVKKGLENFFYDIGKYNATIDSIVTSLPRNRVKLKMLFKEGVSTKIKQINIIGNKKVSTKQILSHFDLHDSVRWWNILSNTEFNKQKFFNDLKTLRDFYLERGYIAFNIESSQVSFTSDKKGIYITINIVEGDIYKIAGIYTQGNMQGHSVEIKRLTHKISSNQIYNSKKINHLKDNIKDVLGHYGYNSCRITVYPELNAIDKTVKLHINIDSGKRYYVHQVRFEGNTISKDIVLRRETRQMEGAWLDNNLLKQGKERLNRTGYFESVDLKTKPILKSSDQLDVIYKVKEHNTGTFDFGFGYGSGIGIRFQGGMNQNNWLGTGNNLSINTTKNEHHDYVDISMLDPYFTVNGISLSGRVFHSRFKADNANKSGYTNRSYGINGTLGFPVSEKNTLQIGLGYVHNDLSNMHPHVAMKRYFDSIGNPLFLNSNQHLSSSDITFHYGWIFNNLNNGIFPTSGNRTHFSGKVTIPGSYNSFYKVVLETRQYISLVNDGSWVILGSARVGYGTGIHEKEMPFYENFYGGGFKSVRGFKSNTLGPKAVYFKNGLSSCDLSEKLFCKSNDAIGGDAIANASLELIMPTPLLNEKYKNSFRTSIFIDAGTVWDTKWQHIKFMHNSEIPDYSNPYNIRISAGIALQWLSPLGPIVFSYAKPLKIYDEDKTEPFQFNIGTTW
ncbi:outer membrane protein assembly factor BamA [Pantoea sp. Mhis]|uniref:outer membrane protein assembly factor BamA n=1 Tax=Pantoea sp. Mhis TaxID=2576759 RepID=UPI00135758C3|nr:outer membrane protein assembly factor BamA [Pantoea sp. Mhis]MXP56356.1 outer membrane protein assembly factor BamA [Pantoea sp. Mhis]